MEVPEAIDIEKIATSLPRRLHAVIDRFAKETPDHVALVEDGVAWSYRELDKHVHEIARQLSSLGIRAGDRMMIVSENCIALAGLLFAAGRLDAWRLSPIPAFRRARSTRFTITAARAACFSRPPSQRKVLRTVRALARRCARLVHSPRLASAA